MLTYSPLGKAFKKQTKVIEGRFQKQILDTEQKSIPNFLSKCFLSNEVIY